MRFHRIVLTLMLFACLAVTAAPALAAQGSRTNYNAFTDNQVFIGAQGHQRQTFVNNFDVLQQIMLKIGGNVTLPYVDYLTFTLYDGCNNQVFTTTVTLNTSGLTTPTSTKWVTIPLGNIPLTYGNYYSFEVSTYWAGSSAAARLVLNTDRYGHGRLIGNGVDLEYPAKKQDIVFLMNGTADTSKLLYPTPATNVACPARCVSVLTEKTAYGPDMYFNVIVREGNFGQGSFWTDYTNGSIAALRSDIQQALEGTAGNPGLRETVPYSEFYANMNFYVAIEDPANDPYSMHGFLYCANIDAHLNVVTGNVPYGGGVWGGDIKRPAWNDHTWGPGMRFILLHEFGGHGVGHTQDEYVMNGPAVSTWAPFTTNSDPIGCPSWCGSYQSAAGLAGSMMGDADYACWGYDDATCQAHPSNGASHPRCYYIGDVSPSIPYFGASRCVPQSITQYNIGSSCAGNSGCYIGAPYNHGPEGTYLNVAQSNGAIMQGTHHSPQTPGYSTGVESTIRTLMKCMFPITCFQYDYATCAAFQSDWDGTDPEYVEFTDFGNACETGGWYRRR